MTINLNKKFISKEELFRYLNEYDVYSHYIRDQEIIVGKNIYSPFRKENNPSFGFFLGEKNEICFNDFTLDVKGDVVKFVSILFDGLTHFEALSKIATDFNMEDDFICKKMEKTTFTNNTINKDIEKALSKTMYDNKLRKKKREWLPHDLIFWKEFGISLKTLQKYNVEPISHIFIGDKIFPADKHAYCFIEKKDGKETYKIYQPFNEKYKWLNNHDESVWQGWTQVENKNKSQILIITKSLKDVMAINENTDHNAVALQCENILPKIEIIQDLEKIFGRIIILYDNDYDAEKNWGQIFAKNLQDFTGFENIHINEKYESKDFTDLIKKVGIEEACIILENEISIAF